MSRESWEPEATDGAKPLSGERLAAPRATNSGVGTADQDAPGDGRWWAPPERWTGVLAGALVCALAAAWFALPDAVGVGDWDWVFSDAWLSASGLLERHAPAFWSVQISGGAPLLGDPQSLSASPLLLLPIALGPIVGVKALVLLLLVVGLVGCFRVGLRWIGEPLGASAFALAFVFSGYFAIHLRVGHFAWAMFYLVPWILLFADRVLTEPVARARDAAGLIVSLVLMFSGPVYQALVFFLLPALWVCAVSRWNGAPWVRWRSALLSLLCSILITMPRWMAVFDWQWRSPREVLEHGGIPLVDLGAMLITRVLDYRRYVGWGQSGIWEYWCYTGVAGAALAAASLVLAPRLRSLVAASIALGVVLAWRAPWGNPLEALAAYVPILLSIRVYSRFLVLVVFGVMLASGASISALRVRSRLFARIAAVLALALIVENVAVAWPIWRAVFSLDPRTVYASWDTPSLEPRFSEVRPAPPVQRFSSTHDNFNSRMLPLLKAGFVVRHAYSALALPPVDLPNGSIVDGNPPPRFRLQNHRVDLWGDFQPGQTMFVRLRYLRHYNWKVKDRRTAEIYNQEGDVAVHILRPCRHVVLRLRNTWEMAGWVFSVLGVAAAAGFLWIDTGAGGSPGDDIECDSRSSYPPTTAAI